MRPFERIAKSDLVTLSYEDAEKLKQVKFSPGRILGKAVKHGVFFGVCAFASGVAYRHFVKGLEIDALFLKCTVVVGATFGLVAAYNSFTKGWREGKEDEAAAKFMLEKNQRPPEAILNLGEAVRPEGVSSQSAPQPAPL